MKKATKKLESLIIRANKKLADAQDARAAVMDYLEEHYGIEPIWEYEQYIEDECSWCYGLNERRILKLIEEMK